MKNQGNLGMALRVFIPGLILVIIGLIIGSKMKFNQELLAVYIIFFALGGVFVILGIIFIANCIKTMKVNNYGKESICRVVGYHETRNRYRTFHFIVVEYTGESGRCFTNKVQVNLNTISRCPIGTKIYCKVLGDRCYVNGDAVRILANQD